jgi:hypothetical protein
VSAGASGGGSCCVRVDNVDKTVQKAELFGAFAKFGTLEDCNIVRKGNPYHAIIRQAHGCSQGAARGLSLGWLGVFCGIPSPFSPVPEREWITHGRRTCCSHLGSSLCKPTLPVLP